jgi:hypothetical protein
LLPGFEGPVEKSWFESAECLALYQKAWVGLGTREEAIKCGGLNEWEAAQMEKTATSALASASKPSQATKGKGATDAPTTAIPAKGAFLPAKGASLPAKGASIPAKGVSLTAKGASIPAKGVSIPAKGASIPAKGGTKGAKNTPKVSKNTPTVTKAGKGKGGK